MADTCRCHLPLDAPDGPHWWPSRDPEPGPEVQAVALLGCGPSFLRYGRVPGGWRTQGAAASYTNSTPPQPWAKLGRCWDGVEHAAVDVTTTVPPERHRAGERA